ncbi:MAG: FHA domain-containing protein [Labilithrix sp.]|nr:FHA domain-containing protein [Labilithrix sp.]MCW5811447.1 FHA domain-containing protein [Labilithrix sp.]
MATGLKLRIKNTANDVVVDRTFTQFPVRIGRNTLNDLCIVDRFVSQFHAVVELHGDELMLRDLGSSNGTKLSGNRAPAHTLTSLEPHKNSFGIGPLTIDALVAEVAVEAYEENVPQSLGEASTGDDEGILDNSFITNINETLAFNDPKLAAARAQFEAAEGTPGGNLQSTLLLDQSEFERKKAAALEKARQFQLQQAAQAATASVPPVSDNPKQRRLEQIALQGVREIASTLLPHAKPLDDPEDLARFLTKLRDTVEVFLRAFVPLRDGYRQFASQMQIQRGPAQSERRVETAKDERELAEHLLDWTQKGREAHKAIEGTFADLMIHQLALLHAIMRGVKSLLDELSPKATDAALEELKKQGKTNFMWGPWRFKELWRVYGGKHGDMDDGDKRMFAALFGADFAESYKQYRSMVDTPEDSE